MSIVVPPEDSVDDSCVELGFAVAAQSSEELRLHANPDWQAWDGGLLGGKPSLLLPCTELDCKFLLCPTCLKPLSFLLQVYAPRDDLPSAFHRSFYAFICRNTPECLNDSSGLIVLRAQCSRSNPYYSEDSGQKESWKSIDLAVDLGEAYLPPMLIEVGIRDDNDSDSQPDAESPDSEFSQLHGSQVRFTLQLYQAATSIISL